jgi:hypothetical protein
MLFNQVLQGRLYAANTNSQDWAVKTAADLLSLTIYLYDVPDMDFILHLYVSVFNCPCVYLLCSWVGGFPLLTFTLLEQKSIQQLVPV